MWRRCVVQGRQIDSGDYVTTTTDRFYVKFCFVLFFWKECWNSCQMIYLKCFLFFLDPPTLDPLFAVFTSVLTETTVSTPTHTQNWEIMDEPSASRLFFFFFHPSGLTRDLLARSPTAVWFIEKFIPSRYRSVSPTPLSPFFYPTPSSGGAVVEKRKKDFFLLFFIHYDDPVSMWRRRR